ncbi:hypothetical protein DFH06DRAFT_1126060 [Mycena polygramma]|nr:hypothetical protein DFH06DRAFT_1126060 [Mycena polygramma]
MGPFTTYQLMISLSYSTLLNFSHNDFVVAGPGASSGLMKMFGHSLSRAKKQKVDIEIDILRWMVRRHFLRLGIEFPFLCNSIGQELELDLADIEHAVCEIDKSGLTASPALPKAWADPNRQIVRVRPGPLLIQKKWVLVKILDERPSEKVNHLDAIEYQVSWLGYDQLTWEPRCTISQDAPELVREYEFERRRQCPSNPYSYTITLGHKYI